MAVIEPVVEAGPKGFLRLHSGVDTLQFSLYSLNFGNVRVPRGGTALNAVQLLLKGFKSAVKFLRACFVEPTEDIVNIKGSSFKLLHRLSSGVKLALKFLHRGFITGFGGFGNALLQTLCVLFELGQHLLSLFAIDGEDNVGGSGIICHR